jgi:hypothetical protein
MKSFPQSLDTLAPLNDSLICYSISSETKQTRAKTADFHDNVGFSPLGELSVG